MNSSKKTAKLAGWLAFLLYGPLASAGPPFQTDDPQPIDFRNFEFYTFGTVDGTMVEIDTTGPAVELNWGALPNVHLHIIIPAAAIFPSNNPGLFPAGVGPHAFGLGDIELGIKYRFVQETKHRPMVGTFTMFELPQWGIPREAWASGRPGTKSPFGCKRASARGPPMAAEV